MIFMTGCVKTETVIVTKNVAALPPEYLYSAEYIPSVPEGVPENERTAYLLEAYASRGDALKRDQEQAELFKRWVQEVRKIYPESVEHPLPDLKAETDNPETGSD